VVGGAALHLLNRSHGVPVVSDWWITNAVSAIGLGLPGILVATRRPRNPIGWILVAVAFGHAATLVGREYGFYAVSHGLPGADWSIWVGTWAWLDTGLLAVAFAVFPDGRLRGRPWRWPPVVLALAAEVLVAGGNAVYPGSLTGDGPAQSVTNPLGWAWAGRELDRLGYTIPAVLLVGALACGVAAMLGRLGGADRALRRQVLVVVPAALLLTGEMAYEVNGDDRIASLVAPFIIALLATAIAAAILRYGLYDLDVAVSRTLVYGVLTATLAAAYLITVAVFETFVGGGVISSVAGAALVGALFAPLRTWLQDAADLVLFGARRDPYAVIASLGEELGAGAGAVLPALAETVGRTLKLPYVGIEVRDEVVAEVGSLRGLPARLPLTYRGAALGSLVLGPRAPSDPFTRAELRLFEDIARQVGVAAHAVLLTSELQHSRERLVSAREEERRRLRRDLHDGLGPALAGLALQIGSARRLVDRDPEAASRLLGDLVGEAQAAIAAVRRVVYDLRPPALDELGLVQALRQQCGRFPGLDVVVDAPGELTRLPAAVEVAAFRIATEAVTNAARHSGAETCVVRLSLNGALDLEITDDGRGLRDGWSPGVGVSSMRERAAELGGSCSIRSRRDGGTVLHAKLPVEPG
jgi:signal transduction histidine kinase